MGFKKKKSKRARLDPGAEGAAAAAAAAGGGAVAPPAGAYVSKDGYTGSQGNKPGDYKSFEGMVNPTFNAYYKAQHIVADDAEFETLLSFLRKPLPVTFRVNAICPDAAGIVARLQTEFNVSFELEDGTVIEPPRALPWYPNGLAFHLSLGRHNLKKNATLRELHGWIMGLNNAGLISRQEAVSMVPPLLLDVAPHHFVLDMCASPGSKTAQMLEAMHAGEADGVLPTGMVIANDNDSARAYMLVHQCLRINSPALLVTTHDAQSFPSFFNRRGAKEKEAHHAAWVAQQQSALGAAGIGSSSSTFSSSVGSDDAPAMIESGAGAAVPPAAASSLSVGSHASAGDNASGNDVAAAAASGAAATPSSAFAAPSVSAAATESPSSWRGQFDGHFDRILCDVPCTGEQCACACVCVCVCVCVCGLRRL